MGVALSLREKPELEADSERHASSTGERVRDERDLLDDVDMSLFELLFVCLKTEV